MGTSLLHGACCGTIVFFSGEQEPRAIFFFGSKKIDDKQITEQLVFALYGKL